MQVRNVGGTFDQLFLWIFFYEIFTEDASQCLLYHDAKKSKMPTKNSNQRGPSLSWLQFYCDWILDQPVRMLLRCTELKWQDWYNFDTVFLDISEATSSSDEFDWWWSEADSEMSRNTVSILYRSCPLSSVHLNSTRSSRKQTINDFHNQSEESRCRSSLLQSQGYEREREREREREGGRQGGGGGVGMVTGFILAKPVVALCPWNAFVFT